MLGVDLAQERDVPELASLYCQAFAALFAHIGLPEGAGPAVIEALWRSKGELALARYLTLACRRCCGDCSLELEVMNLVSCYVWRCRWLGRVGVVRDDQGRILGALSLQLPGDTAAYESLLYRSYSETYNALNPLDVSTVSSSSAIGLNDDAFLLHSSLSSGKVQREAPDEYDLSLPATSCRIGVLNGFRFRYKHAIIADHVCPPGEAYIDFLAVREEARRDGVGTRLMKWAEQSAEKLGCGRIALSVWGLDKVTQLFYENLGTH